MSWNTQVAQMFGKFASHVEVESTLVCKCLLHIQSIYVIVLTTEIILREE
jgi:hypothetical protein